MRRFSFLAVLSIAVLAMVMNAPLSAQGMMGNNGGNQQMMNSQKGSMWQNQYSAAQKFDKQSVMMNKDFQKLETNFKNTMNQNNMSAIKDGLKQQQTMMDNMQPTFAQQQKISNNLKAGIDKNENADQNQKKLVDNLASQTMKMNENYKNMQNDLGNMMNMDNMSDLQQAMQEHYQSMQNMSQMMNNHEIMAGQMMSMMGGNNMGSNMMQNNNMGQSGMKNNNADPKTMSKESTKTKTGKW